MQMISSMMLIVYGILTLAVLLNFHLRELTPKRRTAALLFAAVGIVGNSAAMYWLGQPLYGKFYIFLVQIPLYIGFRLFSRYHGVKLFFALLSTIILAAPPIMCVTTLRTFYHIDMAAALVTFFISYVLMLLFTWKFLKRDFNYMLENCESRQFWSFCLIPLLDYVYSFTKTKYNFIQPFAQEGFWFRQIPTIIVFASYILLLRVFRSARENQQLEHQTSMMQMQLAASEASVENLRRTQQQAATYRHDLRHHVSFLRGTLEDGQVDRALDYLEQLQVDVERITPSHFCENETANLIFSSYTERAKQQGIPLSIHAELPQPLNIPDTELCAVLSNGIENALHAAAGVEDETLRKVAVDCRVERNMVLLEIENAYVGTVRMKDGLPVSSEKDHGYGCRSMRSIAEQRNGFCIFKAADGIFTLRVVLPMEN